MLETQVSPDAEIRDFQSDARYSEAEFLQVKAIIDRFEGREGRTDLAPRPLRPRSLAGRAEPPPAGRLIGLRATQAPSAEFHPTSRDLGRHRLSLRSGRGCSRLVSRLDPVDLRFAIF